MPKKKTLEQLKLSGTLAKHPERYAGRKTVTNQTDGLGEPPSHLTSNETTLWAEIEKIAPAGLLTPCDRLAVELACKVMLRLRNETGAMKASEIAILLNVLSRLGLTPADRARLDIPVPAQKPNGPDPWAAF